MSINLSTDDEKLKPIHHQLQKNLGYVRECVAQACHRVGRDPACVELIAVTKSVEVEVVRALLECGQTQLAENRVQELVRKAAMIHEGSKRAKRLHIGEDVPKPTWHMIGHLQRNKVKAVLQWANVIHSLDSLRLAEEVQSQAQKMDQVIDVLLQINIADEKSKSGLAVGAVNVVVDQVQSLSNLRLVGLMTMAPWTDDAAQVRRVFVRLRELFEELRECRAVGPAFTELSMGMSGDFEIAIEEGATMIRIGRALYEGLLNASS